MELYTQTHTHTHTHTMMRPSGHFVRTGYGGVGAIQIYNQIWQFYQLMIKNCYKLKIYNWYFVFVMDINIRHWNLLGKRVFSKCPGRKDFWNGIWNMETKMIVFWHILITIKIYICWIQQKKGRNIFLTHISSINLLILTQNLGSKFI